MLAHAGSNDREFTETAGPVDGLRCVGYRLTVNESPSLGRRLTTAVTGPLPNNYDFNILCNRRLLLTACRRGFERQISVRACLKT
jgi:hypothetical protein